MKNSTSRFFLGVMGVAGLLMMCGPGAHAQSAAVQKTATVQKAAPAPTTGEPMEKASADRQVVQADGSASTVVITDWSSHHMVFSNPAKAKPAVRERIVTNPRYIMQLKRQALASRTIKFNSEADRISAESAASQNAMRTLDANSKSSLIIGNSIVTKKPAPTPPPAPMAGTRDWNMSLGTGTVAPGQFPAEVTAGESTITGTGGASPTGNCLTDFVVYGLNTVGTNTQANLIAFDDLYSGTTGSPICGTTANTKWAYNTSTMSPPGSVSNSPVTSGDGTMVAFVENNNSAASLHILRWKDSNGTINAPVTPTAVASMSACSTAPCMATVQFTTNGDSISSPFYDFITDTAYVGDNEGFLYAITGVFYGTPTVSNTAPFSSSGLQVSQFFGGLTSPVYDFTGSGNIFVGSADGYLYAVNATTGNVTPLQVGSGFGSGAITDPPTVDSSNQRVIVSAGANAASTAAVAVQADTTTPLGNPVTANIGSIQGSSLAAEQGAFDTNYYNWSGTGGNPGHFFVIGSTATTTAPTLYEIPFGGVNSVNISGTTTAGYTNPTVTFTASPQGAKFTATGSGSGGIFGITGGAAGTGFTSFPGVTVAGTGTGATGAVTDVKILTGTLTSGGSNYGQVPTVSFSNGSGATGTAALGIDVVTIPGGSGGAYTTQPAAQFGGGGTGATSTTTSTVTHVTLGGTAVGSDFGSGYTSIPTVSFAGTHTTAAAANAIVGLTGVTLTAPGSGYTAPPTVSVTGGTGTTASATTTIGLATGTYAVSTGGVYTGVPSVTFPAGSPTPQGGSSVGITSLACPGTPSVTLTCGSGFTSVPTVNFSGTHTTAAVATALLGVASISFTGDPGTGFTSVPTVSIGSAHGAAATAVLGVLSVTENVTTVCWSTLPTGVTFTGGGGSGAAVTVTQGSTSGCSSGDHRATLTVSTNGSGYTSVPTAAYTGGTCSNNCTNLALTAVLEVVGATMTSAGSGYTGVPTVTTTGGGVTGSSEATGAATLGVVGATVTTAGAYQTFPTSTTTGGGGGTQATFVVTGTVANVIVTTAGNYSTGPVTPTFGAGGTGASVTLQLGVTSVTPTAEGSYSVLPSITIPAQNSGSGTTITPTYSIQSINLTAGGAYTTFPTASFGAAGGSGATVTSTVAVSSVAVTAAGTGYNNGPVAVTFSGTGSGGAGTADLKVVSLAIGGGGGDYTAVPVATFTDPLATGSGAVASLTLGVLKVGVTAAGSGYTGTPTATVSGGGGTGSTGWTATIAVNSVVLTYGGGDYATPPTVTISGGSGAGVTGTATINPGNIMTTGTSPATLAVSATANVQTSPISDVFNTATNADTLFYGFGTATTTTDLAEVTVSAAGALGSSQTLAAEPDSSGGSSGIVVDPFTSGTNNQANSIYFATQGSASSDSATISTITSPSVGSGADLATVTTTAANDFASGDIVVITGSTCTPTFLGCGAFLAGSSTYYNGTWTITHVSATQFTFTVCTGACLAGSDNSGGTALDNGLNNSKVSFKAVKLTQSGLQ